MLDCMMTNKLTISVGEIKKKLCNIKICILIRLNFSPLVKLWSNLNGYLRLRLINVHSSQESNDVIVYKCYG